MRGFASTTPSRTGQTATASYRLFAFSFCFALGCAPAAPDGAASPAADQAAVAFDGGLQAADGGTQRKVDTASGGTAGFDLASMALSGTRLKVKARKSPDGAMLPMLTFYDTKFGHACTDMLAMDGKTRCLPAAVTLAPMYADAECLKKVAVLQLGQSAEYVSAPVADAGSKCGFPRKMKVLKLGMSTPLETLHQKIGENCTPLDANAKSAYSCSPSLMVEEELSPSEFVELTEVTLD